MNSVGVDDWTVEWMIITSNVRNTSKTPICVATLLLTYDEINLTTVQIQNAHNNRHLIAYYFRIREANEGKLVKTSTPLGCCFHSV